MKKIIFNIAVLLFLACNLQAQLNTVMVNSNGVIQSPTNFWQATVNTSPAFQSIKVGGVTNSLTNGQIFAKQAATNSAAEITLWSSDESVSASFFMKKQNLQTNWNITSWGNNIYINGDNEHTLRNSALPASYFSIENNYDSSSGGANPQYGDSVTEMYFTTVTSNSFNALRGWSLVANQKYPANGVIYSRYPTIIISSEEERRLNGSGNHFWDEYFPFKVSDTSASGQGLGGIFLNPSTNNNASIRVDWALQGQFTSDVFWIRKFKDKIELRNNPDGFTMMSSTTNGVLIGGTDNSNALSRVHLGGNTRIDGAITWNNTTNAATTRTNLGLGNGITTNVTFVDAALRTNSITISNGVITGWSQ